MTIGQMLNKAQKFERGFKKKIAQTLRENKKVVLDLQESQLLSGQDANGKWLTPSYLNDPFFKSRESAERYRQRKIKKSALHEGLKRYDIFGRNGGHTPNLIYSDTVRKSQFYRQLKVEVADETLRIHSSWSKAPNVENKYPTATGLSPKAFKYIWDNYAKPDLIDYWNNLK
jgi:hypothetical protein